MVFLKGSKEWDGGVGERCIIIRFVVRIHSGVHRDYSHIQMDRLSFLETFCDDVL